MEYSLRQAITPTGNWVVPAWHNADGNNTFAFVHLTNPGLQAVAVTIEVVGLNGASRNTLAVQLPARGGLRWAGVGHPDEVNVYVRCTQPIFVTATQYAWGGAYNLPAFPLPPG